MSLAELRQITRHYRARGSHGPTIRAVDGIDLQLSEGRTLGLVGESGSGKSTTARLLLRLVAPTSGRVIINGTDITKLHGAKLRPVRAHMQMVFQDPYSSFDPLATIADSIGEALRTKGRQARSLRAAGTARVLEQVGLARSYMGRHPGELSGGQLQRAAIARALAVEPQLIALDEAVSSLDVSTRAQIINLLVELQQQTGMAYLFISHDLSVVRHVSHDIAVMYLGRIVEVGPATLVYHNPKHPYTQALLSAVPLPNPERQKTRSRIVLTGEVPSAANPPSGCRFRTRCPFAMPVCVQVDPPPTTTPNGQTVYCHLYQPSHNGNGATTNTART